MAFLFNAGGLWYCTQKITNQPRWPRTHGVHPGRGVRHGGSPSPWPVPARRWSASECGEPRRADHLRARSVRAAQGRGSENFRRAFFTDILDFRASSRLRTPRRSTPSGVIRTRVCSTVSRELRDPVLAKVDVSARVCCWQPRGYAALKGRAGPARRRSVGLDTCSAGRGRACRQVCGHRLSSAKIHLIRRLPRNPECGSPSLCSWT